MVTPLPQVTLHSETSQSPYITQASCSHGTDLTRRSLEHNPSRQALISIRDPIPQSALQVPVSHSPYFAQVFSSHGSVFTRSSVQIPWTQVLV